LSQRCNKVLWALLGAAVIITLITIPAVYYSSKSQPFTLDDYFNDTIRWRSYYLHWISDKEYLHKTREGDVFLHNVETKEESLYLNSSIFEQVDASVYLLSADYKYVALEGNATKKWRHSYTASYSIYDREFVTTVNLPHEVQYFTWAPAGNKYAFVYDYNIFLMVNATDSGAVQLTTNGKKNEILNGVPDWVYEEEVFASNAAVWWSPTGKYLAYAEFNDTEVQKVEYTWFGSEQYPETVAVPYPKAGSSLTKVKLYVLDTTSPFNRTRVKPPASVSSGEYILCSVTWATDGRVAVQWLTRKQNHLVVQIYDFDGNRLQAYSSRERRKCPLNTLRYVPGVFGVKWLTDDFFRKGIATPITSGKWEVIYISKLTNLLTLLFCRFFLHRVMIGSSPSATQCLTCDRNKDRCLYNSGYLSVDASYYRMDCYELAVLEDNSGLANILSEFQMPTIQHGTLKIAGFDLWYEMMLPPNFKKTKKYPLLIDVYAGPCSQSVEYRFKLNWGTYLASSHGIIVASFDGRGSGYQGDDILHAIYKRLGSFEVEDQIAAVRKFIDMGFIDKDRIAIWGWSYGGYVASMALGAGTGLFKCGMAVAPVAKWEYYDAVYTERYMGTPSENSEWYKNSSVTPRAKNFKTVDYLLVHGTADDNVHFQQAAQISKALVDEQVGFETMWYTDKNHNLGGPAHYHIHPHESLSAEMPR
uniref:Dipeptidyl peptidase 4-like n=1 Tax=Salarias fasciatus TaxID=181472 RepID=A0A672ILI3_SALFA